MWRQKWRCWTGQAAEGQWRCAAQNKQRQGARRRLPWPALRPARPRPPRSTAQLPQRPAPLRSLPPSPARPRPLQVDARGVTRELLRLYFGAVLALNEACVLDVGGRRLLLRVTACNTLEAEAREEAVGYHCYRGGWWVGWE